MPAPYSGNTSTGQPEKTTTQLSVLASRFSRQPIRETSRKERGTLQQFIHLRAHGLSYDKISAQLNVSKPTLIQWSRKHQFDIQNLRAIETEALAEKCFAGRQQRWEQIGRDLRRVQEELAKRDLADVPTAQLLSQAVRLRAEASREVGDLRFSAAARHIPSEEYFEEVLDWQL